MISTTVGLNSESDALRAQLLEMRQLHPAEFHAGMVKTWITSGRFQKEEATPEQILEWLQQVKTEVLHEIQMAASKANEANENVKNEKVPSILSSHP